MFAFYFKKTFFFNEVRKTRKDNDWSQYRKDFFFPKTFVSMSFERLRHSFSASNCVDHDIEGETAFARLVVSPFITGFPKDPWGYLVVDGRDNLTL